MPRLHTSGPVVASLLAWLLAAACDPMRARDTIDLETVPALEAEPGMRIGSVDDPTIGFTFVAGVDLDDEGNLYVLEASVPEIRVYGPDGSLLHRIGGRGGGPGEFSSAPRFGVRGDTVWTVDLDLRRITLFDRRGSVLSTGSVDAVQVPLPQAYGSLFPWIMREDGTFLSHFGFIASSPNDGETGVRPTDSIPVPFVRFDATGAVIDTVGRADRPPPRMWRPPSQDDTSPEYMTIGNRRMAVPRAPTTLPWWMPVADGYVLVEAPVADAADAGHITVTRIGVTRDTAYSRTLRYRPVPYAPAALDSIAAHAARGEAGGMVAFNPNDRAFPEDWERIARVLRGAMNFPRFRLPIERARVAQDESVWLRQWDGVSPTARWILLDDRGRPRGSLDLPRDVRVQWSRGDVFWATVTDDLDVPWLVRFTIHARR